jgi:hypothetical protein
MTGANIIIKDSSDRINLAGKPTCIEKENVASTWLRLFSSLSHMFLFDKYNYGKNIKPNFY